MDTVHQISYLAKKRNRRSRNNKKLFVRRMPFKAQIQNIKKLAEEILNKRLENNRSYGIDMATFELCNNSFKNFTGGRLKSFF